MKSLLLRLLVITFISIPVYSSFAQSNTSSQKSTGTPYLSEEDWIEVMFNGNSRVRMRNNNLVDLSNSDALSGVDNILNNTGWHKWYRISDVPESIMDEWEINGEKNSGIDVYNLNNIYRLQIQKGQDVWAISKQLESLPGIYKAMPVPKPVALPTPPNYQNLQGYLRPASNTPTGIDANYAWTKSGGTGTGVTVCDLEYSWNYYHNDISKAAGSQINSNVADPFNNTDHGTAVIGELVADNDGVGTTGICYGSGLKTCGTYYGTPSPTWNVPGAMSVAIANLSAGDVILIEQQWPYSNGGTNYIPIEWWGDNYPNAQTYNGVYAAIVNAVTNGITVVEAGGNGSVNTGNLQWYGNSGAIIVGAGGATTSNDLQKLSFSSYGPRFDMQGWGENVFTTGYGDFYNNDGVNYYYTNTFNGTSSASPIVAAAVACLQGYYLANVSTTPMSPSAIRTHLKTYGTPQATPPSGNIGPRPDLKNAIDNIQLPQQYYDWGDAPDPSYPTTSGNNGAYHLIGALYLGNSIDAESNGQPNSTATGDDNDGNDDEDGIIFNGPLAPGTSTNVTVISTGQGYLQGWIDFNQNGIWDIPAEQIFTNTIVYAGTNNLSFSTPTTAIFGPTIARFRLSSFPNLVFYGYVQDGEVEDYEVEVSGINEYKWEQLPDLSDMGMDVNDVEPVILADDFLCTMTGPITQIQIWGSWYQDYYPWYEDPGAVTFTLSIHGDIPAGVLFDYSMPDTVLWMRTFVPGEFSYESFAQNLLEGWYNPPDDFYDPNGDTECWLYTFNIDTNYFIQRGTPDNPIIYWLDVQAVPEDPQSHFGWKTSQDHWNDDAVWGFGIEPKNDSIWNEMIYPPGHPWAGESIDLAFRIKGEEAQDEYDWGDAPDPSYPTMAANNGANHFIDGITYLGASVDTEAGGQQDPNALGDDNDGNDDEDGVNFVWPCLIGNPAKIIVNASATNGLLNAWIDFNANGSWADPGEQIFTDLPLSAGNNVLTFIVPANAQTGTTYARFRYSTVTGLSFTGPAPNGEVEDYEVEISSTDYKWIQQPDTTLPGLHAHDYIDATGLYKSLVKADDWMCNGGLVTDIHWWGNYEVDTSGAEIRGAGIDHFHLSIHSTNPTACLPQDPELWGVDVPFSSLMELSTGMINSDSSNIYLYEYYLNTPFAQDSGTYYWLDISAYSVDPGNPAIWRWQEALRSTTPVICGAAEKTQPSPNTWSNIYWPSINSYSDMAFIITSEPVNDMDYGDAPDPSYPTLQASDGARHLVDGVTFLGAGVDTEPDGQQSTNALGDDNDGNDDEDGVTILSPFSPGGSAMINVVASVNGYLNAWIDYNNDGDWADANEQIITDQLVVPGSNTFILPVPANAVVGKTFARYRFSSLQGLTYKGVAPDGEVEDYQIEIEGDLDFGDAPDPSYPTLLVNNGARHIVDTTVFLGNRIDAEPDGLQSPAALGDDNNNTDDEDGVQLPAVIVPIQTHIVTVTASTNGYLNAWIDFNLNGSWGDAGEQIFTDVPLTAGTNTLTFNAPPVVTYGTTFARFRFSTVQGLSYKGQAPDGEVEDYQVEIAEGIKWVQLPDLDTTGIDVNATEDNILADDFECTATGPITKIDIWGSWLNDNLPNNDPQAVMFILSLHSDIPATQSPTGYSMPGDMLWMRIFSQGEFTVDTEAVNINEGWYDPDYNIFIPVGDHICWKYSFDLESIGEVFLQTGSPDAPVVYWLDVQAIPTDTTCYFGWKTSLQHWNDDAVWTTGLEPYNGLWNELTYPANHPMAGESMDLAFAIHGYEDQFILADLKAFLEGPYQGNGMTTALNDAGLLPLHQPFDADATAKWYYSGTETVSSIPDSTITDWILIELRDASSAGGASSLTTIGIKPAFIKNDGTITGLDGLSPVRIYTPQPINNYYVVLWHRNHLGVISSGPLNVVTPGVYSYDFTTGAGQAYNNGQKNLGGGVYGMFGGDGTPDGVVDTNDKAIWTNQSGTAGYLESDYNMDTQVDNKDKNDIWVPNKSTATQVPN